MVIRVIYGKFVMHRMSFNVIHPNNVAFNIYDEVIKIKKIRHLFIIFRADRNFEQANIN